MTGAGGSLPHGEYLPFYPNLNREPIYAPNYPPSSWDYIAQEGHINRHHFFPFIIPLFTDIINNGKHFWRRLDHSLARIVD